MGKPVQRLFGTDGIRGKANSFPMNVEIAQKLGQAVGCYFRRRTGRHHVLVGKDTRLSGYMLESALASGFLSAGMDVTLLGPLPTPAVSALTRSLRADLGVMISASHNPYQDNGLKLFGPDGYKLSDGEESQLEKLMGSDLSRNLAEPDEVGKAFRLADAVGRYIEIAKSSFPRGLRLDGIRIVVDAANGAAYHAAPTALWELGAEVIKIGCAPNGRNINFGCGSTAPKALQQAVVEHKAYCGIALDGDADRLLMVDEHGRLIDGDHLLAYLARFYQEQGALSAPQVVGTQMANLGLEKYISGLGLDFTRTPVGDRYVLERMRADGANLGGEQSGHILVGDYIRTGDGLVAALQVLSGLVSSGQKASHLADLFASYPQILLNVPYSGTSPLTSRNGKKLEKEAAHRLKGKGRVLLRNSGTEPLVRIMVEAESESLAKKTAEEIRRLLFS